MTEKNGSTTLEKDLTDVKKALGLFLDPLHLILVLVLGTALFGGGYLYMSRGAELAKEQAYAAEQDKLKAEQAALDALKPGEDLVALQHAFDAADEAKQEEKEK